MDPFDGTTVCGPSSRQPCGLEALTHSPRRGDTGVLSCESTASIPLSGLPQRRDKVFRIDIGENDSGDIRSIRYYIKLAWHIFVIVLCTRLNQ